MIQDGHERPPGHDSAPITRVLRMDADGRVIRDPETNVSQDQSSTNPMSPMSLADLLPESASGDLVAAIRAAADTGNAQFLEFDLLSEDGIRRIHAEAASDPEHQGEFVVTAREYSPSGGPQLADRARAEEQFVAMAADLSDLGEVFQNFSTVLANHLTYDRLNIVTVSQERDEQYILFSTDADQEPVVPLSGTAVEIVSRINESLVVPAAIPSVIVVPLRTSGDMI